MNADERPIYDQIYDAIIDDKHELLKTLLTPETISLPNPNRARATPLEIAIHQGALEAVQICINAGADINARDRFYYGAPLSQTIRFHKKGSMRLLLEAGAECAHEDWMLRASETGEWEYGWLLLDHGDIPSPNVVYLQWGIAIIQMHEHRNYVRRVGLMVCSSRCRRAGMDKNVMRFVSKQIWSMRRKKILKTGKWVFDK